MRDIYYWYSQAKRVKLWLGLLYVLSRLPRMALKGGGILRASAGHGRFSRIKSIEYERIAPAQPFGEQRMTFSFLEVTPALIHSWLEFYEKCRGVEIDMEDQEIQAPSNFPPSGA